MRVMTRNRVPKAVKTGTAVLAGGAGGTAIVLLATIAFACTEVMGPLTLTPTSGPGGTVVMTTASGLKVSPAQYALHLGKTSSSDCMAFKGVTTLKTVPTDASGGWSNVSVTIPRSTTLGTHGLCGMEVYPIKGQTGTMHDTFTVT